MIDRMNVAIFVLGFAQWSVLVASVIVPVQLKWRTELAVLPRLHRQLYSIYGGYTLLSIITLGLVCVTQSAELADGSSLARLVCFYGMIFWGLRLSLQAVLDVRPHLTARWLWLGYHTLTVLFVCFTVTYGWAAIAPR
jgi:hypothetical protein